MRRLTEYIPRVIKHPFRNCARKVVIMHKETDLNDLGLIIRSFDISKIKIFDFVYWKLFM